MLKIVAYDIGITIQKEALAILSGWLGEDRTGRRATFLALRSLYLALVEVAHGLGKSPLELSGLPPSKFDDHLELLTSLGLITRSSRVENDKTFDTIEVVRLKTNGMHEKSVSLSKEVKRRFSREWYERCLNQYRELTGINLTVNDRKMAHRTLWSIFAGGYPVEDVMGCMRELEDLSKKKKLSFQWKLSTVDKCIGIWKQGNLEKHLARGGKQFAVLDKSRDWEGLYGEVEDDSRGSAGEAIQKQDD